MELYESAAKAMMISVQSNESRDFINEGVRIDLLDQIARGKQQLHMLTCSLINRPHVGGLDSYQWSEESSCLEVTPKCLSEALRIESNDKYDMDERAEHVTAATIMYNMGLIHMKNGDFNHAGRVFEIALELRPAFERRASYGTYDISSALVFAALYNNIGYIQFKSGNLSKAKATFLTALEIGYTSQIQCDDIVRNYRHLGTIQYNIGIINAHMGLADKAMQSFDSSLGMQKLALGETHPDVASVQHNIGMVYLTLNKINDAMDAFLGALGMIRFALGNDHFLVAKELFHIGKIHEMRGDYDEALHAYEETLRVERLSLGSYNLDTVGTLCEVDKVHLNKGNLDASLNVFSDALAVARSVCSKVESQSTIVSILVQMMKVNIESGNIAEATRMYGEVMNTFETDGIGSDFAKTMELACMKDLLTNPPAAAAA